MRQGASSGAFSALMPPFGLGFTVGRAVWLGVEVEPGLTTLVLRLQL